MAQVQELKFICFICGQELLEKESTHVCSFCGKPELGEWVCPNGHYTCEECRLAGPAEMIERVCLETRLRNPREIAELIMRHPAFKNHGVEHHLLVAPVILVALANVNNSSVGKAKIQSALKRLADIPIGVCGSRGDCGACVGAGAAMAIISGMYNQGIMGRGRALKATGAALLQVAEMGGIRCCKQSVYAALETCCRMLQEELNISLEMENKIKCAFSLKIADCKKEACPYY
ncbi:MAG: DUF5714 domain-containing protein [Acidobacteria bacterium]|jgi:hypothetical protein|nr:DUF5714 domain-containing protein [Acidobacteriota bacterium]